MAAPRLQPDICGTLLHSLEAARARTDSLFLLAHPEALTQRPIPERHRLIFYLGHLEAFDWNLIARGALDLPTFHPGFDRLFAFGIDPVSGNLPADEPADWPPLEEIQRYRETVRQKLDSSLAETLGRDDAPQPIADGTLLHVAIEHRLMHAETLAYLLHELAYEDKYPQPAASEWDSEAAPRSVSIPAGGATLGRPRTSAENGATKNTVAAFGWDNEFEEQRVAVPAFGIGAYPVTNREFLAFIRAGGYEERTLWAAEDWEWKAAKGIEHPHFWARRGDSWDYRGMFARFPLPLSWPVYVSHAEASAYARWAGKSLPTEAQWHRAAYGTLSEGERWYPWGDPNPEAQHGNFDFARWEPTAVGAHPAGASAFGVADLLGNGWEWTSTPFGPFPGFRPFPFYPGYSADFFDGRHYVMKGGSPQTAACMLRRTFRNWFQPRYPYVYAKFRCVEG
jgi:iron(II)-dependent oxidoreductase